MLLFASQLALFVAMLIGAILSIRFSYLLSSRYPSDYNRMTGYPSFGNAPADVARRTSIQWRYFWNREYLKLQDPKIDRCARRARLCLHAIWILSCLALLLGVSKSVGAA